MNRFYTFFLIILFVGSANAQLPGEYDPTFYIGTGANSNIQELLLQPDGKLLAAGGFSLYDGFDKGEIVRLLPNGMFDPDFSSGTGVADDYEAIFGIDLQPDGKIIIGGSFSFYNGTPCNNIARLLPNGQLDTTFDTGIGSDGQINDLVLQPDGKIVICGYFTAYDGIASRGLARINTDGSFDTTFMVGTGATDGLGPHYLTLLADNKLLISGNFDHYDDVPSLSIAKVLPNGAPDLSFSMGTGVQGGFIYCTAEQPDGKVLIGGNFAGYAGYQNRGIARLLPNGLLDTTFNTLYGNGFLSNRVIHDIDVLADGKILLSGYYNTFNGVANNNFARLLPDGTRDPNFHIGTGTNWSVHSCVVQDDGKIYISGQFTEYNGIGARRIARLHGGTDYTSLEEGIAQGITTVFPNPADGLFTVSHPTAGYELRIINALGEEVLRESVTETTFHNQQPFPPGIYVIQLNDGTENSTVKLVVH